MRRVPWWGVLLGMVLAGGCARSDPETDSQPLPGPPEGAAAPAGVDGMAADVAQATAAQGNAGAAPVAAAAGPAGTGAGVAPGDAPQATPATPSAPAGFDPASVPATTASLPPFPFFTAPEGLQSGLDDKDKNVSFDAQYYLAGDKPTLVEGRIFHDMFNLQHGDRTYSEREFHRNYENAITALGGRRIDTAQYTRESIDAAGGRDQIEKSNYGAALVPDYLHHSYLVRTPGKEYWIEVSTGTIPLHGYVVVLERKAMAQSVGFLDAAAMKQAIDANGRVALHINFDVDKASLRADAQPVIDEITKLLRSDPALSLSIEGHTDDSGSREHNQALSTARARSVLGALVGNGIDPARLSSAGYGQDKPVADNGTEAGRAQNRRVELVKR